MGRRLVRIVSTAAVVAAAGLAGCSGGGSGGGIPAGPATPATIATPASAATAVSSPTTQPTAVAGFGGSPSPATASTVPPSTAAPATAAPAPAATAQPAVTLSGSVVDAASGSPLAGAVVVVSHTLVPGAAPPASAPADGALTATARDGSYAMTIPGQPAYPSRLYLEIFANGTATVHDIVTIAAPGRTTLPAQPLTALTADETNWIVSMNADRAAWNAGPVVADETAEEVARLWVAWLGAGHFEHVCGTGETGCPNKAALETADGADFSATGENIADNLPSYAAAESAFMAEQSSCPAPVNVATCPFSEATGHFLNLVDPHVVWVGVAEDLSGLNYLDPAFASPYYDQEFAYPNLSGDTIASRSRGGLSPAARIGEP